MAEYYKWANVDKGEYISPWNFDLGNRRTQSLAAGNPVLCALGELLGGPWKGDRILFLGDECSLSGEEDRDLLRKLYGQCVRLGYPREMVEVLSGDYKNVSGLFRAAEKVTRADLRLMQEEREEESIFALPNEYGVDWGDPYAGLFGLLGRESRYVVNHTKEVCYSLEHTRILDAQGQEVTGLDPLPLLMGCGREAETGAWVGDVIGVADETPDGVKLLQEITLPGELR